MQLRAFAPSAQLTANNGSLVAAICEVLLTEDAQLDRQELYDHIPERDAPAKAATALDRIEHQLAGLANMPERGAWPKELLALGIREYRETCF